MFLGFQIFIFRPKSIDEIHVELANHSVEETFPGFSVKFFSTASRAAPRG